MKFPKSLHAEGWSNHIDTTPGELNAGTARANAGAKIDITRPLHDPAVTTGPLHAAKPASSGAGMGSSHVAASMPARPAVETTTGTRAAALPPRSGEKLGWMIGAGAGAAVIAAIAVWAVNRPADVPNTPPAIVTGSAEPQAEVAAATPAPEAASAVDATTATATTADATRVAAAEPARLGPPVTTVKPAVEARTVAQAPVAAPRPDLVVRGSPRDAAPAPTERTPYLQPTAPVVAAAPAPATEVQPLAVRPGTAPINLPPTAAGPVAATTPPPAVTPEPAAPVAVSPTPDPAVTSTSPGTPPLAQAALPAAEDSGITVKVRSALAADSTLAAVPISVSTDHGVVKLEGQVPDAPTRDRATVVASSAAGVKAVDNRLTLPPATVVGQAAVN